MSIDEWATMTDDDRERAGAIAAAAGIRRNPVFIAKLVFEYYHDHDRAERTPRDLMYLHLGILSGVISRENP
jgi:hypothetical protein